VAVVPLSVTINQKTMFKFVSTQLLRQEQLLYKWEFVFSFLQVYKNIFLLFLSVTKLIYEQNKCTNTLHENFIE